MGRAQCSQDELQFKGVFFRYLVLLAELATADPAALQLIGGQAVLDRWHAFVAANAEVIWTRAAW